MPLNTAIRGAQIEEITISGGHLIDSTVPEVKLDVSNDPVDGYVLAWASGTSKMEWSEIILSDLVVRETPTGDINNSNKDFVIANSPLAGSESVYLNGLLQEGGGIDYTIADKTISFVTAPQDVSGNKDIVLVTYLKTQGFGGGSIDHATLTNLDYASAGHTGFTSSAQLTTTSGDLDIKINAKLSDVVNDTTPQLGGDLDTNSKSISWMPASGTNDTATGDIATMTVDANASGIAAALYIAADGNFEGADADVVTTMPCFALALETGTGSKKVLLRGFMRHDAWAWTPGGLIYVSTDTCGLTQTAPAGSGDQVQIVGVATHADRMFFNPQYGLIEIL